MNGYESVAKGQESAGTEEKSLGVVRDMWISLKLFLEVVIKRKSNSWDVRTLKSIVWNVIELTRDRLKANKNNAEYCIGATPREHNVPSSLLITLNKRLRTSPETNFQLISGF